MRLLPGLNFERNPMLTLVLVGVGLLLVLVGGFIFANRPVLITVAAEPSADFPEAGFPHDSFEQLLKIYVDPDGLVDYQSWHDAAGDRTALNQYLAAVAALSPDKSPDRFPKQSDALAYWLYAYNAYVIYSILAHWPLESVTEVRAPLEVVTGLGFFYRQRFLFGGEALSLYAVENDIIRPRFRDPRIHFVLNCASASCPVLRPELPIGAELEALLASATMDFVSDRRNVHIDHATRTIIVSTIFKWYEKDFINELRRRGTPIEGGVIEYIASVAPPGLQAELEAAREYETRFEDYDWSLNNQH